MLLASRNHSHGSSTVVTNGCGTTTHHSLSRLAILSALVCVALQAVPGVVAAQQWPEPVEIGTFEEPENTWDIESAVDANNSVHWAYIVRGGYYDPSNVYYKAGNQAPVLVAQTLESIPGSVSVQFNEVAIAVASNGTPYILATKQTAFEENTEPWGGTFSDDLILYYRDGSSWVSTEVNSLTGEWDSWGASVSHTVPAVVANAAGAYRWAVRTYTSLGAKLIYGGNGIATVDVTSDMESPVTLALGKDGRVILMYSDTELNSVYRVVPIAEQNLGPENVVSPEEGFNFLRASVLTDASGALQGVIYQGKYAEASFSVNILRPDGYLTLVESGECQSGLSGCFPYRLDFALAGNGAPSYTSVHYTYDTSAIWHVYRHSGGDGPTITEITPSVQTKCAGQRVIIKGSGFAAGAQVTFNGMAATNVNVVDINAIACTTPDHTGPAGYACVTVTNPDSSSATNCDIYLNWACGDEYNVEANFHGSWVEEGNRFVLRVPNPPAGSKKFKVKTRTACMCVRGKSLDDEWHFISDGGNISGSTTSELTIDPLTEENSGEYAFVYEDADGNEITTNPFMFIVVPAGSLPMEWWPVAVALLLVALPTFAFTRKQSR